MMRFRNFSSIVFCALFAFPALYLCDAGAAPPPNVSEIAPACASPGDEVSLSGNGFGAGNVRVSVAGIDAEVIEANGHSVVFQVPTEVPPGLTEVAATNPGGHGGTIDFQVKQAEICANQFDDDCDGGIDELDECPVTTLSITAPAELSLETGATAAFTSTVDFTSTGTTVPFTIELTQTIDSALGIGLSVTPPIDGEVLNLTSNTRRDFAQTLSAQDTGSYTIRTTATIVETGQSQTAVTRVTVNKSEEPEEAKLYLEILHDDDPLPVGDPDDLYVNFGFSPQDKTKAYTVRFDQTITPPQGLAFKQPLDGKVIDVTGGRQEYLTQELLATQEGEYDVFTTATVVETGYSISVRNEVRLAAAGSPNVSVIGPVLVNYTGRVFPADLFTEVYAWVDVNGRDADKVDGVTVEERRTGREWKFKEKPSGAYDGNIEIDTRGMGSDDCFNFRAIVHTSKGDRESDYWDYCVTGLPLEFMHIPAQEVYSGFTAPDGTHVAKDLINVMFKRDVPESRIQEIIATYGATIIGARPESNDIQIRLVPAPDSFKDLMTIIHRMSLEPEVRTLGPTYYAFSLLSLSTNDPDRALQPYLKTIRKEEDIHIA